MDWRRLDTLFLRLFVLMWVALVLSSTIAFSIVVPTLHGPPGAPGDHVFGRPELPPSGLHGSEGRRAGPAEGDRHAAGDGERRGPRGLPPQALWLDYAIRIVVTALFAAAGARWLSTPMKRLTAAAGQLTPSLREGRPLPSLDVRAGTVEVQDLSKVFNDMAGRLQVQFDIRGLHLAAVSHDLRTPLTRLRLRLEGIADPKARLCIRDIFEMNELIDSSLAVLREQREGAPPSLVELGSLLQAVADDHVALGSDVVIRTDANGSNLFARAHPAGLRRVLSNIVGNAVRYGQRARLSASRAPEGSLVLCVDDDGPGIPAENLQQVLQPWVRLQADLAGGSGYGLGLAIASDLIERDGGRLTLSNRVEGGLRVELVLPEGLPAT